MCLWRQIPFAVPLPGALTAPKPVRGGEVDRVTRTPAEWWWRDLGYSGPPEPPKPSSELQNSSYIRLVCCLCFAVYCLAQAFWKALASGRSRCAGVFALCSITQSGDLLAGNVWVSTPKMFAVLAHRAPSIYTHSRSRYIGSTLGCLKPQVAFCRVQRPDVWAVKSFLTTRARSGIQERALNRPLSGSVYGITRPKNLSWQ